MIHENHKRHEKNNRKNRIVGFFVLFVSPRGAYFWLSWTMLFIEVGYRDTGRGSKAATIPQESLMLTTDENIVNVRLAVQYQINNAGDYLFNVKDREATLKQLTESVERAVIGANNMDFVLTEGRSEIVAQIKRDIQAAMDDYKAGIIIASVNLQDAQPPEEVQGAFEDAIRAREDKQRLIDEAKGETERFNQLLVEYEKAPAITRKRLYLEAREKLFSSTNKVIVDAGQNAPQLYMPLQNPVSHPAAESKSPEAQIAAEPVAIDKNYAQKSAANALRPSRSKP